MAKKIVVQGEGPAMDEAADTVQAEEATKKTRRKSGSSVKWARKAPWAGIAADEEALAEVLRLQCGGADWPVA
jgi:hypothetical protein